MGFTPTDMDFAVIEGNALSYRFDGASQGTPLVFINSLGSDYRIWDAVIPTFTSTHPILRYDMRGHGLSDCPPGPYSIRDHSNDLAGLVERLQIADPVIIGISVGGQIALDYALARGDKVKALVVSNSGAKIGNSGYWAQRIAMLRENGMAAMAEAILSRWFVSSFSHQRPADYRGYANMLTRTPLAGYIGTCQAIRDADLRDSLQAISVRTLILCGNEDLATPPSLGRELAANMPAAAFDLIQNAAHLPCIEQPAVMAAKIGCFLEENGYVG